MTQIGKFVAMPNFWSVPSHPGNPPNLLETAQDPPVSRWTVSWFIEFAISGTLALTFGLISLALAVWIGRVAHVLDRVLISLSAAGSLTWNTETVLAAFRKLRSPATAWGSASGER